MPEIILRDFTERALRRVSPIYEDSRFIREFYNGVGAKIDLLREYFKTLREQSFIETVDWAIAYQEMKYSLDIRPDLTLEERRARLGIKARRHFPINPAVLEKALYDNFGLETYLYEKDAGYIKMYMNYATPDSYANSVQWLLREKPAHLVLESVFNFVDYIGGEGEQENVIYNPDVPIPLPKSEADKKNYPRIFAGVCELVEGVVDVSIPTPQDSQINLFAGVGEIEHGEEVVAPAQLKHSQMVIHAGVCWYETGSIFIDSAEKPIIKWIKENPHGDLAIADIALPRGDYYYEPPIFEPDEQDVLKIFLGFPISRHRRVRGVALPNPRNDLTKAEIKDAGQYAVDKSLLKNTRGEFVSRVIGAAWKKFELVKKII